MILGSKLDRIEAKHPSLPLVLALNDFIFAAFERDAVNCNYC